MRKLDFIEWIWYWWNIRRVRDWLMNVLNWISVRWAVLQHNLTPMLSSSIYLKHTGIVHDLTYSEYIAHMTLTSHHHHFVSFFHFPFFILLVGVLVGRLLADCLEGKKNFNVGRQIKGTVCAQRATSINLIRKIAMSTFCPSCISITKSIVCLINNKNHQIDLNKLCTLVLGMIRIFVGIRQNKKISTSMTRISDL